MKVSFLSTLYYLLSASTLISALPAPVEERASRKLVSYADAFSGQFRIQRSGYTWVDGAEDEDGYYLTTDAATNSLVFASVDTGATTTFVNLNDVKDAAGKVLEQFSYEIQASRENILFATDYKKQYRHSFFANYWVYNRESKKTVPLVEDQDGDIQYAGWSTKGDKIAFVRGNDLYIWVNGEISRITTDGGVDVFNGVPDWVYEEEIYGDTKTLWWSPDGEYVAFLRMNETGVPTYTVPYYQAGQTVAPLYPDELDIRYPKVGETNPTVTFHLLAVDDGMKLSKVDFDTFAADDLLITEVAWVTDDHSNVMFRTMNRVQDLEKLVLVDVKDGSSKVVRERDGTDGWIDNNLAITYVPKSDPPSYVDLSDHSGYTHLYLYAVDGSSEPQALTSGKWEVTSISKIDTERGIVYYISTERDSTERHLFAVSLTEPGKNKKALVNVEEAGFYAASFSTQGGYYLLSYNGPNIPWQKLYSVSADGKTHKMVRSVQDNAALKTKLDGYKLPQLRWSTLKHPEGYELNVLERLPANFNPSKKYPVLFDIYGGPGSQETGKQFRTVDWNAYVGSDRELEYIVLAVDNRGTGFKGREFRSLVTRQLGKLEADDQVWAASEWAKKDYVNKDRIVIWGWSYGGYLSAKVVEKNSGVFTLALITAPVSDWRFYDTMYTERFMKRLEDNTEGYKESAIVKPEGFKEIKGGFLIQHGTGDDNVHFQHAATMVDTLMQHKVSPEKMRVQWFTDSDHSIRFHLADTFLYKQLTDALYHEKNRRTEKLHQWDLY